MPATSASAPGKIILFGEHAVVYGRPAVAVPVTQVSVHVMVSASPRQPGWIEAPAVGLRSNLADLQPTDPLAQTVRAVEEHLRLDHLPAFRMKITSTIPVAAGLGSGAAVSVAIARALSAFTGSPLPDETVSAIAFRIDQMHHGTPSGIDNTVITYAQPVLFIRGQPFKRLTVRRPFTIVIGNTGIPAATGAVVAELRQRWLQTPDHYEPLFTRIGSIAAEAGQLIELGRPDEMGSLMLANHNLLREIDVSCPELDRLVDAACAAGALGAKMSGGGRGGNMIALVLPENAHTVAAALQAAGAIQTIVTQVK